MTKNKKIAIGLALVGGVALYLYTRKKTPNAGILLSEFYVKDCECYRVDRGTDGNDTLTKVDKMNCVDDFASPSLAHCEQPYAPPSWWPVAFGGQGA